MVIRIGTNERGSNAHLTGAMIAAALGVRMTDVPYKGTAPALTDLMGGTSRPIVDALNAAVKRALQAEELLARLRRDATLAEWTTPERTLEVFRADRDQAGRIIRSAGIALE